MPKPMTGVYRRSGSTRWQLRIKAPSDRIDQYPTEWACRVSLDTSDLREANEKAAKLWVEWTSKFDEQRKQLNAQRIDSITPEMAETVAQRVYASVLAGDDALRANPDAAKALVLGLPADDRGAHLSISGASTRPTPLPVRADEEVDVLEGLPAPLASELGESTPGWISKRPTSSPSHAVPAIRPLTTVSPLSSRS